MDCLVYKKLINILIEYINIIPKQCFPPSAGCDHFGNSIGIYHFTKSLRKKKRKRGRGREGKKEKKGKKGKKRKKID
jgi:hypothetical protein